MFSRFFSRSKSEREQQRNDLIPPGANWAFLGADMHSHFIPGIDDGAKTMDESLALIRAMVAMGYRTIITTPHIMVDYYPNNPEIILSGLEKVQEAVKNEGLPVTIKAAAEYYIDETFIKRMQSEPLLTITGNEVLVEFSMIYEPPLLSDILFQMQSADYKPILAHPERYNFLHNDMERYAELKDRGCKFQMNMLSLTGYYGRNVKITAEKLLHKGMYDYCGSDMHHEKHAAALAAMASTEAYLAVSGHPFLNSKLCL